MGFNLQRYHSLVCSRNRREACKGHISANALKSIQFELRFQSSLLRLDEHLNSINSKNQSNHSINKKAIKLLRPLPLLLFLSIYLSNSIIY